MVSGKSNSNSSNSYSNSQTKSSLPLVPESVLKKRHDLDDLARKRAALEAIEPARKGKQHNTKKNAFYVIKPETILAHSRSKRNHKIRFLRVQKKGMQQRASHRPITAVKRIPLEEEDIDVDASTAAVTTTTTTTESAAAAASVHEVSYRANSVGSNMVFVIRIRDGVATPNAVTNVLCQKLRLRKVHDGVFVRYDATTRALLHLVEPWVVYGPIPPAVIHDVLVRRGHVVPRKNTTTNAGAGATPPAVVPLSDNTIIEEELGSEYNVLCVEDLVHELHTVGTAFDYITQQFLYPIQLADSKTSLERRVLKLQDHRRRHEYGDRGAAIVEYLQQVL
jgi:60S ribosomal protein uL30